MNKLVLWGISILLFPLALPAIAQDADPPAAVDCHQGLCSEYSILGQQIIYQAQQRSSADTLYQVDVKVHSFTIDSPTTRIDRGTQQVTQWVYCSTSEPFVAFESRGTPDVIYLSYINPGGQVFHYNIVSHQLYWMVCHHLLLPNPDTAAQTARLLGYSTELSNEQHTIPKALFQRLSY